MSVIADKNTDKILFKVKSYTIFIWQLSCPVINN
jgi:hypothetical protein